MPFIPGSKPEQVPTWGQIRALFSLRWLRMWFPAVYTIDQLRNTRFLLAKIVVISDSGKMGILWRDDSDTTSADDGQDCIITADDVPVRFKRRSILRKYTPTSGTDTTMEVGSMVYDSDFLHVKTASSTIEKVPLKLQTQGNVVASTASGGASDQNFWTRIGTVTAVTTFATITVILGYALRSTATANCGFLRLVARRDTADWYYAIFMSGSYRRYIGEARLVKVSDTVFEVWIQKGTTYGQMLFSLVAMNSENCTISLVQNAAWQSAGPVSADPAKDVNMYPESGCGLCTTATRPAGTFLSGGYNIWDNTINKQIFYNGANWRDAMGTAV